MCIKTFSFEKQRVITKTWSPPPWLGVLSRPQLLNDLFLTKYNLHYKNLRGEHNFIRDPLLHNYVPHSHIWQLTPANGGCFEKTP